MTTIAHNSTARLFGALAVLVALLASMVASGSADAAVGAVKATTTENITFSSTLKAKYKDEHSDGDIAYGVTILRGSSKADGKKIKIERISVYNYVNGSGPISGFLSLDWGKGTHVAFNASGQSQLADGTTIISANLTSFEASGKYAGYTAFGTMVGTRKGAIGTAVTYTFNITLQKP